MNYGHHTITPAASAATSSNQLFAGKVVLVTGGNTGIGAPPPLLLPGTALIWWFPDAEKPKAKSQSLSSRKSGGKVCSFTPM
jgi:hypothetical protein